jgi:hypothetical protein
MFRKRSTLVAFGRRTSPDFALDILFDRGPLAPTRMHERRQWAVELTFTISKWSSLDGHRRSPGNVCFSTWILRRRPVAL